jgi:hypothetical protein
MSDAPPPARPWPSSPWQPSPCQILFSPLSRRSFCLFERPVPNLIPVSRIHTWNSRRCGPGCAVQCPSTSNNAQYGDVTAVVATCRSPSRLVGYPETYLGRLELGAREWRFAVNVWKSSAVLFLKAATRSQKPNTAVSRRGIAVGLNSSLS